MMITKMVLENFKSYAGAQEIGPLHKRFSSIVGPNGSGKSNVIDALLFVFGARAKKLRQDKVSGLIHKSSGFPNLDHAKVEVHFQLIYDHEESDDDFEVVPGSEFVVSRIAYSNNQSKYMLDGRLSSFTEVGVLLRKHGVDLDNNRFLILQGEVELISQMKPKGQSEHDEGLLEYLEDIIGSNQFVKQIEEIGKELEQLNEDRVDKVKRLKDAEKERDKLSGSKAEAEALMDKEKEIRRRKNVLYQAHEAVATKNVADFTERRKQAQEKLDYEKSKQQSSEDELKEIEATYKAEKAAYDAVHAELDSASANFAAYERKDVELTTNMKHTKGTMDKLKAAVAKDQKKEEDSVKEAEAASATVAATKAKLEEATANKAAEEARLEEILEGLRGSTQELRAKLEAAQADLADAERATASIQTEKEGSETALQLLRSRADAAQQAVASSEAKLAQLREDAQAHTERLAKLEAERVEMEGVVKKMQKQAEKAADEEGPAQAALRAAVTAAEEAKATVTAQQQNGPARKNVELEKIMAAAKKGGPLADAGVRGRLGDLGTIPAEFDVAMSTCCGLLDHIVVDTTDDGQKCVNFLRERNIGRANFILLNQVQQYKSMMERPFAAPAGAQRLFDLVTPSDPSLSVAFYMALRDTLVAPNLDTAMAAAYQGGKATHRVVSMDGNLIDTSGSMTGGGKVVKSGAMKLQGKGTKAAAVAASVEETITPAQIAALEARVVECEAALTSCRAARTTAEKAVKDATARLKAIAVEVEKLKMQVARGREQEQEVTARVAALRSETDLSPAEQKELKELQARIAALDADISRTSPNITTLRRAVSSLQSQIRAEGGPKLAAAQDKVQRLAAQLDILNKQVATKEVDEKGARKAADKAQKDCAKNKAELEKMERKYAEYVKEQADMENAALELIQTLESAQTRKAEQEVVCKQAQAAHEALEKKLGAVRKALDALKGEVSTCGAHVAENEKIAKDWRKQLAAVRKEHEKEQVEFNDMVKDILRQVRASARSAPSSSGEGEGADANAMEVDAPTAAAAEEDDVDEVEVLPDLDAERLEQAIEEVARIAREINLLEEQRKKIMNSDKLDNEALRNWIKKNAQYRLRLIEVEAITAKRNEKRRAYEDLRRQRLEMFMSGFGVITLKLKEMYQMITLGGDAELELVDSLDPFSEGIVFSVRPPKKSWKNISNLSGGEKTLSSLALVFALHHYKVRLRPVAPLVYHSFRHHRCPFPHSFVHYPPIAHASVRDGRDRRRAGLQERVHRGQLHQGSGHTHRH